MDDGICSGPCNHRWRKAQAAFKKAQHDYDPLDPDTSPPEFQGPRPMDGHPWCLECTWLIRKQLAQLDLLTALRTMNGDGYPADAGAERVSGSREPTSPSPAADDDDDVARMLAGWVEAYREYMKWPSAPRYGDLASMCTECTAWLGKHLDGILVSPMAFEFGDEVMRWHADLKNKTKAGVRTLKKPLRCLTAAGGCGLLMLWYTDGDEYIRCRAPGCTFMMRLGDYYATVEHVVAAGKAV